MNKTAVYKIEAELRTEVLVIGGGLAGICSAIQAGRLGCKVILVEKDEVLGGNAGPKLGICPSGADCYHPYASETGIIAEIEEEIAHKHTKIETYQYNYNTSQILDTVLEQMLKTAGVMVLRNHCAKTPIMTGPRHIAGVLVEDTATFKTKLVKVSVCVIEASGDGQIAKEAEASFRMGREARSEFGERSGLKKPDNLTLGTSIIALVRKTDRVIKFIPPHGTPPFEPGYGIDTENVGTTKCLVSHAAWHPDSDFCFLSHTETGGQRNVIEDEHEIYQDLLHQLYSTWNHIKNEAHPKESANWDLVWISQKVGKRESRRFIGDYILTQTDVEEARYFEDTVGYGGFAIDLHDPCGTKNKYVKILHRSIPPVYSIPYRCLYSKDIDNLFLAGRLISVTHWALGSVRVHKTGATAAQAVGIAAALCKRYRCTPREIYHKHLKELQQLLLKEDGTILTVPNEDRNDLARIAMVTATSEEIFEVTKNSGWIPLDRERGIQIWDWSGQMDYVKLYLKNESPNVRKVFLSLRFFKADKKWKFPDEIKLFPYVKIPNRIEWGSDNTIQKFKPVTRVAVEVPARYKGWARFNLGEIKLERKDPTSDEERYLLLLSLAKGVFWGYSKQCYDFVRRCWKDKGSKEYSTSHGSHLFKVTPRPAYGEACNVINGWNRRFSTNPVNMWISKYGKPLPQSLILEWEMPQVFNTICLTFNTIPRTYLELPINSHKEVFETCVKDYRVEIWESGKKRRSKWRQIISVTGNYNRRRIHIFKPVNTQKLRLTVLAANVPNCSARVYEIRVYNERGEE